MDMNRKAESYLTKHKYQKRKNDLHRASFGAYGVLCGSAV